MSNNYRQTKKVEAIIAGCMLFFVAVVVLAVGSFISLGKARRKAAKYDEMIASLTAEKASIEDNIDYVNSPEYLESQAREHLGMIKKGENLYIFED